MVFKETLFVKLPKAYSEVLVNVFGCCVFVCVCVCVCVCYKVQVPYSVAVAQSTINGLLIRNKPAFHCERSIAEYGTMLL